MFHLIFLWLFFFSVGALSFLSFSVFSFFSFLGCVGEANCCVTCWATSWGTGRGFLWGEKIGKCERRESEISQIGMTSSLGPNEKDYVGGNKLKQASVVASWEILPTQSNRRRMHFFNSWETDTISLIGFPLYGRETKTLII